MLECRECVLRSIRALVTGAPHIRHTSRPPLIFTTPDRVTQKRPVSAAVTTRDNLHPGGDIISASKSHKMSIPASKSSKSVSINDERALRREMQYLNDPVKFAGYVHYTLRSNNPKKALDLCHLASRSMECVVAWNHIIDWLMKHGRIDEAIKVYNDMKKRAQYPDSYTYLLLLRGFPQYRTHHTPPEVKKGMVAKAMSIYYSMSGPSSRVKPSIIHTNAALRVCSLARDMSSLWKVVSQLPESGPGSADCVTYTILLSAIRHSAYGDEVGLPLNQVARMRQRAVDEGRRIWQDIVIRWRSGDIIMDEALVCEMGHVLLTSKRMEDWDDVLSLVEQTTNIKRLLAPLGAPERHTEHVPKPGEDEQDAASVPAEEYEGWSPTLTNDAFKAVDSGSHHAERSQKPRSIVWVQPGNALLNVLIQACTSMRASKALLEYWNLLIVNHKLVPDHVNYQSLLQFMRVNRNSARAAAIIDDMYRRDVELRKQTFRIALSVCARNPKNPNVLEHAGAIVGRMLETQKEADLPTLVSYLDLVARVKDGRQVLTVLDKVQPIIDAIYTRAKDAGKAEASQHNDTMMFFQAVIGAIDVLSRDSSVLTEDIEYWKSKRSELDSAIGHASNSARHQRRNRVEKEESIRNRSTITHRFKEQRVQSTFGKRERNAQQGSILPKYA